MVCLCLGNSVYTGARSIEVPDQGFGPDCRYCKVEGSDRALYILRVDESQAAWSLVMFTSPKAQLIAPLSGGRCGSDIPHRSTDEE